MPEIKTDDILIKKKEKKTGKIPNIVIVSNDARFARMLEIEFAEDGYDCRNFNITGNINSRDTNYFSEIVNYCFFSHSSLIVIVASGLKKYSKVFGDFIGLVRKISDIRMILASYDNYAADFMETTVAKSNVILVKRPFNTERFLKEIRLFLSKIYKNKPDNDKIIQVGELSVNESSRCVKYRDEIVDLTKKEYDLLAFMAKRKGESIERKEIFTQVWGFDYVGDTNTLDVYMNRLRSKIDRKYNSKFIHTIRGVGYMMKSR